MFILILPAAMVSDYAKVVLLKMQREASLDSSQRQVKTGEVHVDHSNQIATLIAYFDQINPSCECICALYRAVKLAVSRYSAVKQYLQLEMCACFSFC